VKQITPWCHEPCYAWAKPRLGLLQALDLIRDGPHKMTWLEGLLVAALLLIALGLTARRRG
jgi:hypothetical protein